MAAIARLMEAGAQTKSAYVRLGRPRGGDLCAGRPQPGAALTFVGWLIAGLARAEALLRAAAVLIITCPCALGLAAPAVQIAASGRLFRKRRAGQVRRRAGAAGRGRSRGVRQDRRADLGPPAAWCDAPPRLVAAAAPLARASRHPLAQALAREAGPGPVAARRQGDRRPGRRGPDRRPAGPARPRRLRRRGQPADAETVLWFARDGEAPRRLCFADTLRADAARPCGAEGPRPGGQVLSGDTPVAVRPALPRPAGIERWRARPDADREGRGHRRAEGGGPQGR